MRIDVLLPTYNRSAQMGRAVESFLCANQVDGVEARLVIVDNNSRDDTAEVARSIVGQSGGRVRYLFEKRQGRALALNAGIAASCADVIAMFDDDETVDASWLERLATAFADPLVEFVGGKVLPKWEVPAPYWFPPRYSGVIGHIDHGDEPRVFYEQGFNRMLSGGNTAIRRETLARCGPYQGAETYAEDRYMDEQLRRIGARGLYDPLLIVLHDVPGWRLTRKYYRHWAYVEGTTVALASLRAAVRAPAIFGAPPWMWRRAAGNVATILTQWGRPRAGQRFQAQLELVELCGYLKSRVRGATPHIDRTVFSKEKPGSG